MQKSVKVGLWGVGLNTYWGQFEELLPDCWIIRKK